MKLYKCLLCLLLALLLTPQDALAYRDLETGTFITRDPAGFVDGPNVYTYVRQNPWTMFDPLGLREQTVEEGKVFEKLENHRKDINKGSEKLRNGIKQMEEEGKITKTLQNKLERNESTARGISKMTKELQEQIEAIEKGNPDPIGLRVTLESLEIWADPEKGKPYNVGACCNQFVNDVLENAGLHPPRRLGLSGSGAKGTTEWHKMVVFGVGDKEQGGSGKIGPVYTRNGSTGAEQQKGKLGIGGVLSYPGHIAIHAGNGLSIGANQTLPVTGSGERNPISIISKANSENQIIFRIDVPKR